VGADPEVAMSVITVSGEMGSLRDELANEICQQGKMELVDRRTLMEAVAGMVEISRDEHQLLAEQGPAMLDMNQRRRRMFAALLESVVLQYAAKGNAVLVGRGANVLLRLVVPGVLMVRAVAPLEIRAQRLAVENDLDLDRARQLATSVDQQRRAYMSHTLGADWASPLGYDLVLNMGRLSLEMAAQSVLFMAAWPDYQVNSETEHLLENLILASRVRRTVVSEIDVHGLNVEAESGRVTLSGYVADSADLEKARRLAEEVAGVDFMEMELEVSSTLSRLLV
jgi:cytidylate kinase